jgi:hypothetical protein
MMLQWRISCSWALLGRVSPLFPFRDGAFDLVIDRHEAYLSIEVFRVSRPQEGSFRSSVVERITSNSMTYSESRVRHMNPGAWRERRSNCRRRVLNGSRGESRFYRGDELLQKLTRLTSREGAIGLLYPGSVWRMAAPPSPGPMRDTACQQRGLARRVR